MLHSLYFWRLVNDLQPIFQAWFLAGMVYVMYT